MSCGFFEREKKHFKKPEFEEKKLKKKTKNNILPTVPNPAAAAANRSGWLVLLTPVRNLPSPVITSRDSTVSATEPSAAEVDSMPPPEKAPPAVIPGNSGTTAGTSPLARAAAASSS